MPFRAPYLIVSAAFLVSCKFGSDTPKPPCPCEREKAELAACEGRAEALRRSLDAAARRTPGAPVPAEASPDDEPAIESGKTYVLLMGSEVVVMNLHQGIGDAEWIYPFGSTCRVDPEATVQVIGPHVDDETGLAYLVRYFRDPAPTPQGTRPASDEDPEPRECPDRTLYFHDDPSALAPFVPDRRPDVVRKLLDSEKP